MDVKIFNVDNQRKRNIKLTTMTSKLKYIMLLEKSQTQKSARNE